jgi:hypothetical protein
LTHASEEFKTSVENLKEALRAEGYEVFDFVGLVDGTVKDVYEWDIGHCIKDCDAFIGICDFPSIGLGWEANQAIRLGKPSLGVAHKDAHVTRLILGAAEVEPNFRFERYEDLVKDVLAMVETLLTESK